MNTIVTAAPPPRQPASACFFSDAGISLLKSVEALYLNPYDDQTGQPTAVWVPGATIGYGHLITQNQWDTYSQGFQQADADALLAHDLAPSVTAVQNTITTPVSQNEFDAMVILTFNIGASAFATSSQRRWLAFRDTEFRFIERNWTPARFGSSSALSRGAYRSALVKDRTVALLQYLKNYP